MARPWSKLKSRIEALFVPEIEMAIHCNVWVKHMRHFDFDEPRHWIMLGHGKTSRIIWDFPCPFMIGLNDRPPRSNRGRPLKYFETGYGWDGRRPSEPSALMRDYLDRPRDKLMEPFEDPWELAAILRAADRRLGRQQLLAWGHTLDAEHPALLVLKTRFGVDLP